MLALAMQALSLVFQRPRNPRLPVITFLLSLPLFLSLSFIHTHTHTHTHTLYFFSPFPLPSPSIFSLHVTADPSFRPWILLPHDKYRANIRQSFLSLSFPYSFALFLFLSLHLAFFIVDPLGKHTGRWQFWNPSCSFERDSVNHQLFPGTIADISLVRYFFTQSF